MEWEFHSRCDHSIHQRSPQCIQIRDKTSRRDDLVPITCSVAAAHWDGGSRICVTAGIQTTSRGSEYSVNHTSISVHEEIIVAPPRIGTTSCTNEFQALHLSPNTVLTK